MSIRVVVTKSDPLVSFRLPSEMHKDLDERAKENGRSLALEVAIRLARSLERDFAMFEQDAIAMVDAFNVLLAKEEGEQDE